MDSDVMGTSSGLASCTTTDLPGELTTETRELKKEDLNHLDKLRYAPIIVQEKIQGRDIRVNIFGEKIFAASITINRKEASLDWRLDLTSSCKEHNLPKNQSERLLKLMKRLRLHYGCIDLRLKPDGTYVFFEINPSGQFLFVEDDTHQPLCESMAELLVYPDLHQF
jgi:glutathione synthase/RimK-type ligase-like ATP-grasp enzyme